MLGRSAENIFPHHVASIFTILIVSLEKLKLLISMKTNLSDFLSFIFLKILFIIFRERGRDGERVGEKYWCVRESLIGCLLHMF